jgi:glycerol-1-phosphate dehydrogenase [NAD(P)+]
MDTEDFVIHSGAIESVPKHYQAHWGKKKPLIIADDNTWKVAGEKVDSCFRGAGFDPDVYLFHDREMVYADDNHIAIVHKLLDKNELIAVVVGSGSLNDIAKRAATECGKTYMVVPTAPSVDGYTSFGAAISVQGFKTTLPCDPPVLVVADTDVLCNAPYPMIASGYGDLSAKVTAGADWLIADILGIEPIQKDIWEMVQAPLKKRIGNPEGLARRDRSVIEGMFMGLVEVGYAMQRYKDSRPASGSDHLMSHVWEMEHLAVDGQLVSHGFKVAIGTLASTALLTEFCSLSVDDVKDAMQQHPIPISWEEREDEIRKNVNQSVTVIQSVLKASHQKFLNKKALEERQTDIIKQWNEIKRRVVGQIIPYPQLQEMFAVAGCPTQPKDIGLSRQDLSRGMRIAQMIRKRYTGLDVAYESGLLETLIDKIATTNTYFQEYRKQ